MTEISLVEIEHRLIQAEKNIRELYSKYNGIDKNLVAVTTTLNNLLTLVGELKEAVEGLKSKPAALWDKLIFALLGAGISAIISYFTGG
jgi:hypothetical protein